MSIHILDLPNDKARQIDLVKFANQLARVAEGVTVTPALRIVTADDTLDILLHRLGAKRQAETPAFPAPETASTAAILDTAVETDSPACSICGRQVRLKDGICLKCRRALNRNGNSSTPAEEVAKAALGMAAAIQADADKIAGKKARPANTRTDARFSEPTVFVEDREQNKRILTRHQQPIRGHKLG